MDDTPLATDGELAIRRLRDEDADYALLVRWRAMPHVRAWWDPDEPLPDLATIRADYRPGSEPTTGCIIETAGRPVGYTQFYRWADHISDPADPAQMDVPLEEDPWGVDTFIGEPDAVGMGLGPRAVALVCRHVHERHGATTVMLTTELANERAQRAYEKAGFRKIRHVLDTDTRDGVRVWCWLMRWDAPTG